MDTSSTELCIIGYEIGKMMPGGIMTRLFLDTAREDGQLTGDCEMTQATHPFMDIKAQMMGTFEFTGTGEAARINIKMEGFPFALPMPMHNGMNHECILRMEMMLSGDWESGMANISFCNPEGTWKDLRNLPVKCTIRNGEMRSDM